MQNATYCPEDNKIRLYVGRVPREEYLKLRAEGWISTPKQDCNFVATWTPQRVKTALEYSDGIIDDEDAGPAERAADRAERFGDYRDKRTSEAVGHADRFDAGPSAHGYQSQARAERVASRHDRIASHAVDSWSKAEYWTRRTAGVIGHALYVSSPDVRMGRIKTLEANLRRFAGSGGAWETHYKLRLAYENQMLEAQGSRAAFVEMICGGRIGGKLIVKVNKSTVTGRVVSVLCKGPYRDGWAYRKSNLPGVTIFSLYQIETERLPEDAYTAPTPESLAEFEQYEADLSAARASIKSKQAPCPLINPTDADAERLQAIWNEKHSSRLYDSKPAQVARLTQAEYSAQSGSTYSRCETQEVTGGGEMPSSHYMQHAPDFPSVAKVRRFGRSVVVITDKPQKPLPAAVWHDPRPACRAEVLARFDELQAALSGDTWLERLTPEGRALLNKAWSVGLAYVSSQTQYGLSDAGAKIAQQRREAATVNA